MSPRLAELDFRAARQRLEAKRKSAGPKLGSIEDAVARIADGDHVALGGILYSRTPLALVRAMLRRRPRHLSLSRNLMCYEGEWCMVAGAVDRVVTSWMGIGLPWGLSRIVREHAESGRVPVEEWSHLGLGLRYRAAAMGVPFLPSLTMLGSDLMPLTESGTVTCPYTGETLHAVPALFPDVALLHVLLLWRRLQPGGAWSLPPLRPKGRLALTGSRSGEPITTPATRSWLKAGRQEAGKAVEHDQSRRAPPR